MTKESTDEMQQGAWQYIRAPSDPFMSPDCNIVQRACESVTVFCSNHVQLSFAVIETFQLLQHLLALSTDHLSWQCQAVTMLRAWGDVQGSRAVECGHLVAAPQNGIRVGHSHLHKAHGVCLFACKG